MYQLPTSCHRCSAGGLTPWPRETPRILCKTPKLLLSADQPSLSLARAPRLLPLDSSPPPPSPQLPGVERYARYAAAVGWGPWLLIFTGTILDRCHYNPCFNLMPGRTPHTIPCPPRNAPRGQDSPAFNSRLPLTAVAIADREDCICSRSAVERCLISPDPVQKYPSTKFTHIRAPLAHPGTGFPKSSKEKKRCEHPFCPLSYLLPALSSPVTRHPSPATQAHRVSSLLRCSSASVWYLTCHRSSGINTFAVQKPQLPSSWSLHPVPLHIGFLCLAPGGLACTFYSHLPSSPAHFTAAPQPSHPRRFTVVLSSPGYFKRPARAIAIIRQLLF
ncbi:hypothetical protein F4780DRAFT_360974 [Xylariomycetidae sp. FL0641]|nr:hypothetical protein F4780DRAFT_360974 [Xylariomycetidae sp. FL0641]